MFFCSGAVVLTLDTFMWDAPRNYRNKNCIIFFEELLESFLQEVLRSEDFKSLHNEAVRAVK
jgi:hypothetical protein